jgi:hypothetical protein
VSQTPDQLQQRSAKETGSLVAQRVFSEHSSHDSLEEVPGCGVNAGVKSAPTSLDVATA